MKLIDISGQTFGRLQVISKGEESRIWLCKCACGNETKATGSSLRRGAKKSCGCLAVEWAREMGANRDYLEIRRQTMTVHGGKRRGAISPEYRTWLGIKRRCTDTKCKDYPNWGGRGIKVCAEWNKSFTAFLADMGPRPAGQTIDRINPNGDYEPSNCRWATRLEQVTENRRSLVPMTFEGVVYKNQADLARAFSLRPGTLNMRLKAGIPLALALRGTRSDLAKLRPKESYLRKDHLSRS